MVTGVQTCALPIFCKLEGRPYDPRQFIQPGDVARTVLNTLALPRSAEIVDIVLRPMKKLPGA